MKFACSQTETHLVDAVDQRLDAAAEMQLHAHVEVCARCRARAELWRQAVPAMRALMPVPPAALNARRLQVEILRRLQDSDAGGPSLSSRQSARGGVMVAVAAAALLLAGGGMLSLRQYRPWSSGGSSPSGRPSAVYATVSRLEGNSTAGGRTLAPAARLTSGNRIEVAATGEVELAMDRGSVLRLFGPARLSLEGDPRAVTLRLEQGTLHAEVMHRLAGESFAVITRDLRVDVRGTRFMVGTAPLPGKTARGAWVRVQEGLVSVTFADGRRRLVGDGEMAASDEAPPAPAAAAQPLEPPHRASDDAVSTCGTVIRSCQSAARAARQIMRDGQQPRAVRVVAAAARAVRDAAAGCGAESEACADELRYLRAEALRGSGRIDDAITAYRALNRAGAPAAMRQNALYAAAEIARRAGRLRDALVDYERALAAAVPGALHEEALVGSMETADVLGDRERAALFARRYLEEFPSGRAATAARRLALTADPGYSRP